MYLLDTVVLSELRKARRQHNVVRWLGERRPAELFVSVITLGEIERGIAKQESINPQFAQRLTQWLEHTVSAYQERILPVTAAVARRWGRMTIEFGRTDADLFIAATAAEHGLCVVTRNARHFQDTGIDVVDPFASLE